MIPTLAVRCFRGCASLTASGPWSFALSILGEGYDYPKPARVVQMLEQILGQGLLTTEGALSQVRLG